MGTVFGSISVETPQYTSVAKTAVYEVRHYAKQLRAETTVEYTGDMQNHLNSPFRTIAGYIFGKNKKGDQAEKVAMTAPVTMTEKSEKIAMTGPVTMTEGHAQGDKRTMTMAFIMPSKYKSIADLPEPLDKNVQLVEVPEYKVAVITFSGTLSQQTRKAKEEELRKACTGDNVALSQDPNQVQVGGYNPPWCLPWLRTNEVAIPVSA